MVLVVLRFVLGDSLAASFSNMNDGSLFVTAWMLAGMCAVAPLSTSLSVGGAIVGDRIEGVDQDFLAAPVAAIKLRAATLPAASWAGSGFGHRAGSQPGWIAAAGGTVQSLFFSYPGLLLIAKLLWGTGLVLCCGGMHHIFIASLLRQKRHL